MLLIVQHGVMTGSAEQGEVDPSVHITSKASDYNKTDSHRSPSLKFSRDEIVRKTKKTPCCVYREWCLYSVLIGDGIGFGEIRELQALPYMLCLCLQ